jgi:tripartite-type tricarboxylate transporter receptor subunit TctC
MNIDIRVPYKGSAPALHDLIGRRIDTVFATAASVVTYVRSGTLRPLAVTTSKRTSLLPDVPTVAELGLPGFEAATWHGLVAPASTPRDVIDTLNRATTEALRDPAVRKSLMDRGVEINSGSPEEFAAYIRSEIPKWAALSRRRARRRTSRSRWIIKMAWTRFEISDVTKRGTK